MRKCRRCGEEKPLDHFEIVVKGKEWRRKVCDACMKEQDKAYAIRNAAKVAAYKKKWHLANQEKVLERVYRWQKENPEARKLAARNYYFRQQHDAIMAYGGYKCACCGETEPLFLSIDHVNNDGKEHRKQLGTLGGAKFYKDLRERGWPEGFQVLCMNCNHGRHRNGGICPHKEGVTTIPKGSRPRVRSKRTAP